MFKMACSEKYFTTALYVVLLLILALQLLSTLERQVFDFLGYMWAPIIGNFFQLICLIIGFFGTFQYRPRFIAVYSTWSLIWLGWNVFVICLYLEVGVLNRNRELYLLNIGTGSKSWWLKHGIGCQVSNNSFVNTKDSPSDLVVQGCLLDYYYVEVIHAAVQCLLSLVGFVFSCVMIYVYSEEDETSAPANDEMEFVKMRYQSPSRSALENPTFDGLARSNSRTEGPPSYETSMRESTRTKNYHGADRQSVRSKASSRSKSHSKQNRENNYERREELPWVQITPSSSHAEAPYRQYP